MPYNPNNDRMLSTDEERASTEGHVRVKYERAPALRKCPGCQMDASTFPSLRTFKDHVALCSG